MLGGAGYNMIAATTGSISSDTLKREVVRLGGAGSEDDFLRPSTDQCGNFLTRFLHRSRHTSFPRNVRSADYRTSALFQERQHGIAHAWIGRRGGLVVGDIDSDIRNPLG